MKDFVPELIKVGTIDQAPREHQECLKQAQIYLDYAYAPYSNFKVGASTLLNDGSMYGGANQENASYPLCMCAERVSLYHMAMTQKVFEIECMAITAKHRRNKLIKPAMPCGACRQVILEYESRNPRPIMIYLINDDGVVYKVDSVRFLLPFTFDPSILL
jgi:cytidine deaminase